MKKLIKTIGTIAAVGILTIGSYLLGTTQAEPITKIHTVTEFEANDGLQLYYEDGSGYYWE